MSRSKMIRKQRIPIPCGVAGCTVTCLRRGDMRRHEKEFHGHKVYCLMPNCNFRGAKRKYRFKAHFLKYHTRHHLVDLNVPMNDHNWPETPQPSGCQMPFYHQTFGGNDSTSLNFPLSMPVVGDSFQQQHFQQYGQQSPFSTMDNPFPQEPVSINTFNLSHKMNNMQINDPKYLDLDTATDVVIIFTDYRGLSQSPSEDPPSPF